MAKWLKRLLLVLALVLLGAILFSAGSCYLLRGTPDWYQPLAMTPEARAAAARAAEDKFVEAQNWAVQVQGQEIAAVRGQGSGASPAPAALPLLTISFREEELNAYFRKLSEPYGWEHAYGKYLSDPVLVLRDGRLIVAGTVKDLRAVVSVHFAPRVDEQGRVRLELVQVLGGKLPLPEMLWSGQRQKLEQVVLRKLPTWQRDARIDAAGSGNVAAIGAAAGKLLLQVLDRRGGDAALFLPLDHRRGVPVKLTNVQIEEKILTLTVQKLDAVEYKALLDRIREPHAPAAMQ